MAENLNCDIADSRCYDDDPSNCGRYGRLYNWETAMSVCPSGWHLPSETDWEKLMDYVENDSGCSEWSAAKHFQSVSGWNEDYVSGGGGEDTYGFSALPGGLGRHPNFINVGISGYWWSSYEVNIVSDNMALAWYVNDLAGLGVYYKNELLSVRCVQD